MHTALGWAHINLGSLPWVGVGGSLTEVEQFGFPGGEGVNRAPGLWEGDHSPAQPEGLFSCQFRAPAWVGREVCVCGQGERDRW